MTPTQIAVMTSFELADISGFDYASFCLSGVKKEIQKILP